MKRNVFLPEYMRMMMIMMMRMVMMESFISKVAIWLHECIIWLWLWLWRLIVG